MSERGAPDRILRLIRLDRHAAEEERFFAI
jgi:hypothetical protein